MNLLLVLTGCMKSYVKQSPGLDAQNLRPALLVNASVSVVHDDNDAGVAGAVVGATQNKMLPEFGAAVMEQVPGLLADNGFELVVDGERVEAGAKADMTEFTNKMTVLSGTWTHEDAMTLPLMVNTPNRRRASARVAETLDDPDAEDAYAYVVVNIHDKQKYMVMKAPVVELSVLVVDEAGEDLLRARAYGMGELSAFVPNRHPDNLQVALDAALADLAQTEVEVVSSK